MHLLVFFPLGLQKVPFIVSMGAAGKKHKKRKAAAAADEKKSKKIAASSLRPWL